MPSGACFRARLFSLKEGGWFFFVIGAGLLLKGGALESRISLLGGDPMARPTFKGPELCAVAPTQGGWIYYSGPVTPYEVENLCERAAALATPDREAVHLEVTFDSSSNSPEFKELASKLKKLEKRGVFAHLHTLRNRRATNR